MIDPKVSGPGAANDRPAETLIKDAHILGASPADVNDAERQAMRATIEAFEWFTLGRKHRIYRPAGVGALRWWKAKIPHRLVSVGNGYVAVVTEAGVPIGNSLRRDARRASKLWIRADLVCWESLLPGNRLFDSIDELLDRRRSDHRKMFSLRAYLVFARCGATQPILARSTWVRLEREIRQSAGGRNPYDSEPLPEWLTPPSRRAAS
ncbi:MAG: hypothetical protein KIT63_03480 [Rhodoferax sp.]|nr:hypothetical protein [Rhodoferax sp.]